MFEWAHRGVAMGQAIQVVLDAADDVTGSVYEDGLATELANVVPVIPALVVTERLSLPLWTPDEAADIAAGRPPPGWHRRLPAPGRPGRSDDLPPRRPVGPAAPRQRGTTALGSIGFFGPPEAAADGALEAEVGYGLVAEARGWGFATEALRGLLAETDAARRTRPGQRRAHRQRPASGSSPSAASPSCAAATRTASS